MNSLADQLVKWVDAQREWQRDLLRRIAEGEILDSESLQGYADFVISEECAKIKDWISAPSSPSEAQLVPLQTSHLAKSDSEAEPVNLRSIVHVSGANRLAPGAELKFEGCGLNIVAGANGSGKSGYTRIIKQVAASRAPGSVLPDVYSEPGGDPSAVISFAAGELEESAFTWKADSNSSQEELRRIRVFDSMSAQTHLEEPAEVAYVPPALQILSEYVGMLDRISGFVDTKLTETTSKDPDLSDFNQGLGTQIIESLGKKSAIASLRSLSDLSTEEDERARKLPGLISNLTQNSPAKLSAQAADRAQRLKMLRVQIERLAQGLGAESDNKMADLLKGRETATKAVEDAAEMLDGDQTMAPRTGNPTWQRLWTAACEHSFLSDDEGASMANLQICPLCQQSLEDEARGRFKKFESFVSNEAQQLLRQAEANLQAELDRLAGIVIPQANAHAELIASYDEALAESVGSVLSQYLSAKDALVAAPKAQPTVKSETTKPTDWTNLSSEARKILEQLKQLEEEETSKVEQLRGTDSSADATMRLREELEDLSIRKKLFLQAPKLRSEHDRLVLLKALRKAKSACSTGGATKCNKALSEEYVDKVCRQFKIEANKLGIDRVPVALIFNKASRGVNYIKVVLEHASETSVTDVLSEGEQRMSAIAGFFADLTESGDRSVLVFDDPVSSLDQVFRRKVARRLLEESKLRQVLVFTHDITFVRELYEQREEFSENSKLLGDSGPAPIHYLHINRTKDGTGVSTESEHWHEVVLTQKIKAIRQRITTSRALYKAHDDTAYALESTDISGSIRECWEILVEQELLGGVVTRFKRSIETQKLKDLIEVTPEDIAVVSNGMKLHSRFFRGHATPEDDLAGPLSPDELERSVKDLDDHRKSIIERRVKLRSERKKSQK